jgi:hypothetical protein
VGFDSASVRLDGHAFSVMAVLRNSGSAPVTLDRFSVEMTTFDAGGNVLAKAYPFTFFTFRETLDPGATTRLLLNPGRRKGDREGTVRRSVLCLKDERGRTVSELEVGPPPADEPPARPGPAAAPADEPAVRFRHLLPDR